ncbi:MULTISPECIES: hypothetical protein [Kocuria]|uniref:hypothetical protein n=1 Tax=Kocuria TaxID=57493 RepID=UPI000738E04A|nr:hypothetical protein [Kocuria palustris]KUG55222.1 hypothetical protein AVL60_02615 [Kocuria palustris]
MPHADTLPATATIDADKVDPYLVTGRETAEPPERMGGRFRFLGPGMITSAAVVGSGELLTATTLDAQVGFMLLWLVLISTFLKVWVQIEQGRWSISTGRVAVSGYDDVPPRLGRRGWMSWLVLLVTAFAVVIVFLLQGTQFSWSLGDLGDGMRFQIALGAMGTAVLHPQGIVPKGQEVMTTISSIFGSAIGTWGAVVFLAGAGVACSRRSSPTSPAWAVRSAARWPSSAPSTGMTSTSASAGCG